MAKDAAQVLEEALALPVEERAALADSLLESIDSDIDEDAEAAWRKEVGKRAADLDSGAVQSVGWPEIETRILQRLNE
jgi:putative addiction module component (TIGR02574 family)